MLRPDLPEAYLRQAPPTNANLGDLMPASCSHTCRAGAQIKGLRIRYLEAGVSCVSRRTLMSAQCQAHTS